MTLEFQKVGDLYVAEFQATSDFALHIEKGKGSLVVSQKSVEVGEYDIVKGLYVHPCDRCVDVEFKRGIYPKWIKIASNILPSVAIVISEGEVISGGIETSLNNPI